MTESYAKGAAATGRGWEGAVLGLLRAKDFECTVTGAEDVTAGCRRIAFTDGGMPAATGAHPTMWVRLWFDNAGKPHQRAYTLVDPDPETGTFALEFALHEGCADDWARAAKAGDTIEATVQGTGFAHPDPSPSHVYVVGDPASLPAVNSRWAPWVTPRRPYGSRARSTGCRSRATPHGTGCARRPGGTRARPW